jgi:hypothetical protein
MLTRRLGGGWVVELVFGPGGHVGVSAMSDRGACATGSVVALEPKANVRPEARDPLEKAGHLILEMIGKAASAMFAARRDEILRRYGLPAGMHPDYEIDHLIPLCLGGSDDHSNLWPRPRRSIEETWNAEAKDRLEHLMCDMVCHGQIDIAAAQQAIATDWIAAYQTYYEGRKGGPRIPPPPTATTTTTNTTTTNSNCLIKGNVNHGKRIYHALVTNTITALS